MCSCVQTAGRAVAGFGLALVFVASVQGQARLDPPFTYQGQLNMAGSPLNGTVDLQFSLWDADLGGNQLEVTYEVDALDVIDGVFTTELDFGTAVFDGDPRWLEIAVAYPSASGAFTTLSPRQALRAAPYALHTRGIHVNDDGCVGIGTAAPTHNFQLAGTAALTATDEDYCTCIINDGSGDGLRVYANTRSGADWAAVYAVNESTGSAIFARSYGGYAGYFLGDVRCCDNLFAQIIHVDALYVEDRPYGNYLNAQINPDTGRLGYDNSTRRDKENIAPLTDDFQRLLLAEPRTYTRPGDPNRWEIGYIAEEFDELGLDKLVVYGKDGVIHGVNYSRIGLYLVEIMKDYRAQMQTKDAQIAALQRELQDIKQSSAALRSRLERLEALVGER